VKGSTEHKVSGTVPVTQTSRFRTLHGVARWFQLFLLCGLPLISCIVVVDVLSYFGKIVFFEQYLGLFISLILSATFITVPATKTASRSSVIWYDWLLTAAGLMVGLYIAVMYPKIVYSLAFTTWERWVLGALVIVLFLEATRRLMGWILIVLSAVFILYLKFAYLFPGFLGGGMVSWKRLFAYLYLDINALLGLPLKVTIAIIVPFVFFGRALIEAGGSSFLRDFAMSTMGRFRGGPAKVAVVASSIFGTITGSVVSNVVMTGTVSIPLMKKLGYRPYLAGAIEAVASTGGQLMPPVMGVTAFIIAEFLSIPYAEVALAALAPALLYYYCLLIQVDLEAARAGLRGLPSEELPPFRSVIKTGWVFLVPLVVLVYTLFVLRWHAGKSGLAGVIVALLLSFLHRQTRLNAKKALTLLEETGKGLLDISVICGVAGIVIGAIQLSGMGLKLSMGLVSLCHGNVVVLLMLTALVSIVLGMGMPTAPVYILLAVLVAPALIQMGIDSMSAHLFIFYFGLLSMITPPVCFGTYAAASLAASDLMQTAWAGMRLGIAAYLIPFMFVFCPSLILKGKPLVVVLDVIVALIAATMWAATSVGFLFSRLNWSKRCIAGVAGIVLLTSITSGGLSSGWLWGSVGLGMSGLVAALDFKFPTRNKRD
jgi:TRAP transporter 4TM/12TM fusion protein